MNQAPISTLQQDQVARHNSTQARRHGADHKNADAPASFADLLRASESPDPEWATDAAQELKADDSPGDNTQPDPAQWLVMAQAATAETAAGNAARSGTRPDATQTGTAGAAALTDAADATDAAASVEAGDVGAADSQTTDAQAEEPTQPRRASGRALPSGAVSQAPGVAENRSAAAILSAGPAGAALAAAAAPAQAALAQAGAVAQGLARSAAGLAADTGLSETPLAEAPGLTLPGTDLAPAGARGPASSDSGAGGDAGMGAEAPAETAAAEPGADTANGAPWDERWREAMEDVGQQVTYWLGKGVRQAQIQVRAGLEHPIEVALSVENGQAALRFLTDNATARAAIESGGAEVLRDWLARDGIGLSGLSVGSQASQGGDTSGPRHARAIRTSGLEAPGATPALPVVAVRSHGARALDVYA